MSYNAFPPHPPPHQKLKCRNEADQKTESIIKLKSYLCLFLSHQCNLKMQ